MSSHEGNVKFHLRYENDEGEGCRLNAKLGGVTLKRCLDAYDEWHKFATGQMTIPGMKITTPSIKPYILKIIHGKGITILKRWDMTPELSKELRKRTH